MRKLVSNDLGKEQHYTQYRNPELYAEVLTGGLQGAEFRCKYILEF